jgi:hypothetical protein
MTRAVVVPALVIGLTLALSLTLAPQVLAAELTAEVVHLTQGQQTFSRVYLKAGKVRMETSQTSQGGQPELMVQIIRQDKGVMWMINPQQRIYYEAPLGQMSDLSRPGKLSDKLPGEVSRKDLGTESIDGRAAKKLEIVYHHQGQEQTVLMWYASDLGLPLKTAAKDGSWSVEYRKVAPGPQADDLFEVPAGFTKMAMPVYQQEG